MTDASCSRLFYNGPRDDPILPEALPACSSQGWLWNVLGRQHPAIKDGSSRGARALLFSPMSRRPFNTSVQDAVLFLRFTIHMWLISRVFSGDYWGRCSADSIFPESWRTKIKWTLGFALSYCQPINDKPTSSDLSCVTMFVSLISEKLVTNTWWLASRSGLRLWFKSHDVLYQPFLFLLKQRFVGHSTPYNQLWLSYFTMIRRALYYNVMNRPI